MTHIAVVTTPNFVFLCSDHRVTTLRGDVIVDQSDRAIKTVQLGTDEIVGFAGLARIGRDLTDAWLMESLAGVAPRERITALAEAATATFRSLDLRIAHAFIGVGFHADHGRRVPHGWLVTNSWDDVENRYDSRLLDSRFEPHVLHPNPSRLTSLWTIGAESQDLDIVTPEVCDAQEQIEAAIKADRTDAAPVMNILAELNRRVATARDDIGASSVVTSLPRNAVQNTGFVAWVSPPEKHAYSRFAISTNYIDQFRGVHPNHWRQPSLLTDDGTHIAGPVVSLGPEWIGPDPHRFPSSYPGSSFGLKREILEQEQRGSVAPTQE